MSTIAAIIFGLQLAAQLPSEADFAAQSVETIQAGSEVQVIARDQEEIVGVLALWVESHKIHISADYPDAWIETVVDTETDTMTTAISDLDGNGLDDLDPATFTTRAKSILSLTPLPQEGWLDCGFGIAATAAACIGVQPFLCVGGSFVAACTCVPLIDEEFEDIECPGF